VSLAANISNAEPITQYEIREEDCDDEASDDLWSFLLLVGILLGTELAGDLDVLIRLVIVVAILMLCTYLVLTYLPRSILARRDPATCATKETIESSDARLQHTSYNLSSTIISRP
jgi:hypothetical protein